jgi:hypothetical protein
VTTIDRSDRDRGLPAAAPADLAPDRADQPGRPEEAPRRAYGWPSLGPWFAAVLGVLVLPVALAIGITSAASAPTDWAARAASARIVSAVDLEREFGVKVNLVAVTAAGGLVDMRVTVIDKDKAQLLFHEESPSLFVESRGAVLRLSQGMGHKPVLLDGATYFFLYPNSGGVVQAGTGVSIVIDAVRTYPITAQS